MSSQRQRMVKENLSKMDTSTWLKRRLQMAKVCGSVFWNEIRKCRTTVKFSPTDEFNEQVNEHKHAPSPTQVKVTKFKLGMKRKVKVTEETIRQFLRTIRLYY